MIIGVVLVVLNVKLERVLIDKPTDWVVFWDKVVDGIVVDIVEVITELFCAEEVLAEVDVWVEVKLVWNDETVVLKTAWVVFWDKVVEGLVVEITDPEVVVSVEVKIEAVVVVVCICRTSDVIK